MRGLTQIRGRGDSFPAVEALRAAGGGCARHPGAELQDQLCRGLVGVFRLSARTGTCTSTSIRYGRIPNIDFIGIDNYMPLSDWRDGEDHADAAWEAIYNLDYLQANVAGGEGYDWYYDSARRRGVRSAASRSPMAPIDEPWVYRYKDLRNWWSNPHHDRIGGVRQRHADGLGADVEAVLVYRISAAPAIDKGTNQPNRFLDAMSSESGLPGPRRGGATI